MYRKNIEDTGGLLPTRQDRSFYSLSARKPRVDIEQMVRTLQEDLNGPAFLMRPEVRDVPERR